MGFLNTFFGAIEYVFNYLIETVKKYFVAVLNFMAHVVNYFKNLNLDPNKQTPFVMDAKKLKEMIHNAPVVNCGVFEAVYNENTEELESYRHISSNQLDAQTRDILSKDEDGLVVLS